MMKIEEAIQHCKEVAASQCGLCAKEHEQLAKWLEELIALRNFEMKYKLVPGKWCSECCFGENHSGIIVCLKHIKQCIPGETVYKEVLSTNGDRIREMSNEELAEFLEENNCPPGMDSDARCPARCSICWLDWLNAEAKEEK